MLPEELNTTADTISAGLKERAGFRGRTLAQRLAYGRRSMPKQVYVAGRELAEAQTRIADPRLMRQVDSQSLREAAHRVTLWLDGLDPAARKARARRDALALVAFNLGLVIVFLVGVLMWRGFL